MKICGLCRIEKTLNLFYFRKDTGKHRDECKECHGKRSAEWVLNNPDRRKEIVRLSDKRNRIKRRASRLVARRRDPIKWAKWNLENPEKKKEINRRWCQRNKSRLAAKAQERRAAKLKATPAWANHREILNKYMEAQILGMEVDHIYPLKHKNLCGLHVETNLQLLTVSENRRKSNTWPWPR